MPGITVLYMYLIVYARVLYCKVEIVQICKLNDAGINFDSGKLFMVYSELFNLRTVVGMSLE